jgi:hypothetical protein
VFFSYRFWCLSFIGLVATIALLFWLYLNVIASMQISAHRSEIILPTSLPTQIHVGNYLDIHSKGQLNTKIDIDRQLELPLKGKYLAALQFEVETPITVNLDYQTMIRIDQLMPVETTTDLIYQNRLLPQFPLKLNIPVKLDVPFHLKREYTIPVKIQFDGPVYFEFNEPVGLHVAHHFAPQLNLNDPMKMERIASFNATMYNAVRKTSANLELNMHLPVRNIHP